MPKGKGSVFRSLIGMKEYIFRLTSIDERAEDIYGSPLPEKIKARLDKELDSIIGNGYAVMYLNIL